MDVDEEIQLTTVSTNVSISDDQRRITGDVIRDVTEPTILELKQIKKTSCNQNSFIYRLWTR